MFDLGWSEMAVIAVVALLILGPKELPNALKTASHWLRTARKMAREFQSGVDQIVRDAELDEARKTVQQARQLNVGREIEKVVDPTGETRRQLNEQPEKPSPSVAAAAAANSSTPKPIEAPTPVADQPVSAPAQEPPQAAPDAVIEAGRGPDAAPEPEPAAAGDRRA